MSEKETSEVKDRRALLKGLVLGSAVVSGSKALPEQWSKPLTNAVVLPSHATTTVTFGDSSKYVGDTNFREPIDNPSEYGDYSSYGGPQDREATTQGDLYSGPGDTDFYAFYY